MLLIVILMFSSVGLGLSNFLVGDEIIFKADWGVPQFFDGVNNKLYWNPEAKMVLDPQLDGMKRADIIEWIKSAKSKDRHSSAIDIADASSKVGNQRLIKDEGELFENFIGSFIENALRSSLRASWRKLFGDSLRTSLRNSLGNSLRTL